MIHNFHLELMWLDRNGPQKGKSNRLYTDDLCNLFIVPYGVDVIKWSENPKGEDKVTIVPILDEPNIRTATKFIHEAHLNLKRLKLKPLTEYKVTEFDYKISSIGGPSVWQIAIGD